MRGAKVVAHLDRPPLLDDLGHEHRVAQRLGHLLAAGGQPGVVHPVAGETVTGRDRLRDLVLVVREDEVEPAAVDVERRAQVLRRHRRALQVPAGAAAAPRRRPGRGLGFTGLVALPQREIARVSLAILAFTVAGRVHIGQLLPRQRAVGREGPHIEVDIPVGGVGVPAVDQALHQLDHLGDMARRAGLVGGLRAAEYLVGLAEITLVQRRPRPPLPAGLGGLTQDLVVDVGDVADERHLVTGVLEPAPQDVEVDAAADVAEVRRSLHGGAAQIDRRLAGFERDEFPQRPGRGVVEVQRHRTIVVKPQYSTTRSGVTRTTTRTLSVPSSFV